MRHFSKFTAIAFAAAFALTAAGCAQQMQDAKNFVDGAVSAVKSTVSVVTQTTVEPQTIYVAINTFDAAKATATNYLRLPRCSATSSSVCRDTAATRVVIKAVRAGTAARDQAKAFLRANPGKPMAVKTYDDLIAAKDTITKIVGTYKAS